MLYMHERFQNTGFYFLLVTVIIVSEALED